MKPDESSGERHADKIPAADIERLLEKLPDSYREWEKDITDPEIGRIKERIATMMRQEN